MAWHEFGNTFLSFLFVGTLTVVSGEHDLVAYLVNIFGSAMFISVVGLMDFGC
jgi:hypothetical protein